MIPHKRPRWINRVLCFSSRPSIVLILVAFALVGATSASSAPRSTAYDDDDGGVCCFGARELQWQYISISEWASPSPGGYYQQAYFGERRRSDGTTAYYIGMPSGGYANFDNGGYSVYRATRFTLDAGGFADWWMRQCGHAFAINNPAGRCIWP